MITQFKIFESITNWNKILHDAAWTHKKKSKDAYLMDFDKIKLAVENGADVDSCGALSWAVRMNNYKVAKFMLENGANVNAQDDSCKWTPLMTASNDGFVKIAKLLIDYDADPTIGNFQNVTVFDILANLEFDACFSYQRSSIEMRKNRDEIYKYLIHHGMDLVNLHDPELAYKYIENHLTDEEKEKYGAYIDARKYNL